jgi:predicted lipoprotein with Yx(FWY)xxD motif
MKKRLVLAMTGVAISAMALAGCSSTGSTSPAPSSSSTSGSSQSAPAATGDDLATGDTSLGTVVVDGKGQTVYLYTKDTANSGMSTCTGQCAMVWPAVTTTSATPTVTGVTGKVGTIALPDGTKQVTLEGWPLYTFASDAAAGDVGGQGVMGIWWAVSPAGSKITKAAAAAPSDSSSGSSAGGGWS